MFAIACWLWCYDHVHVKPHCQFEIALQTKPSTGAEPFNPEKERMLIRKQLEREMRQDTKEASRSDFNEMQTQQMFDSLM